MADQNEQGKVIGKITPEKVEVTFGEASMVNTIDREVFDHSADLHLDSIKCSFDGRENWHETIQNDAHLTPEEEVALGEFRVWRMGPMGAASSMRQWANFMERFPGIDAAEAQKYAYSPAFRNALEEIVPNTAFAIYRGMAVKQVDLELVAKVEPHFQFVLNSREERTGTEPHLKAVSGKAA